MDWKRLTALNLLIVPLALGLGCRRDRGRIVIRPASTTPREARDSDRGASHAVAAPEPARPPYEYRAPSRDGIGKYYLGREIARVMGHTAAGWLERPEREQEEHPRKVIEGMDLKPTDVVADIGAGTGYFSLRIAQQVPQGKVLGVDIQPEMLELLRKGAEAHNLTNVVPVRGDRDNPNLPENGVDVALLVDAYHEFDHPYEMMRGIVKSLRPGGRVVLVEYRAEDKDVPIKPVHKMTEAQAKKEMAVLGLEHVKTLTTLPWQHLMIFQKPVWEKTTTIGTPNTQKELFAISPRLAVRNLDRTVDYFSQKLGFATDSKGANLAVVSRSGIAIQLVTITDPSQPPAATADCDVYIWTNDVDKLFTEFKKNGALIATDPTRRASNREFDVSTPDGQIIRFGQPTKGD